MVEVPTPLVTLSNLRNVMASRGYTAQKMARLVPIPIEDISDLMSTDPRRLREPWLWEAHMLARTLATEGIYPLIEPGTLADDTPEDTRGDLNIWRTGCMLPLSHAIRMTNRLGLSDPYDLHEIIRLRASSPVIASVWNMAPAAGECAYCMEAGTHLDTCIPDLMWGPRAQNVEATIITAPRPRRAGVKQLGSHPAPGLKAVREKLGRSAQNMADNLGCSLGHYSKLECCKARLTFDYAEILRRKFGTTPVELYGMRDPEGNASGNPDENQS